MLAFFADCWAVGPTISGDEQVVGMKGKHPDKQRVRYKEEGDGFIIDALCDDGFTLTFYFQNMPAPRKWTRLGFSPTHSHILFMIESINAKNFTCGLDNLFISAKFCRAAMSEIPQQVMTHGVCRPSSRGLPESVIMHDEKSEKAKLEARGTVKAAVLKDDTKIKDMVAFSVYDTKPVHFISTAATSLTWMKEKKKVYDVTLNEMIEIEF